MSRLFDAKPMTYQSTRSALKAEWKDRVMAGEPQRNPGEFLQFIVKNTDPGKVFFTPPQAMDSGALSQAEPAEAAAAFSPSEQRPPLGAALA